jgi:hypothetical protein
MFTHDEINLMCIYNTATRTGLIDELTEMSGYLEPDEAELLELTRTVTEKLRAMSDEEYAAISETFIPDYEEQDE